ncbi:MAG: PPOX class F420-dependent oxidoreductase [Chloroflexi bacterium]|nr:PPOX class F420-dependent oxidoreductase [Chloroflexota bacterium]
MIGTPDQDAFINKNKWAVVTTLRKGGAPSSSIIFYAREGDTLIFSTTESRFKAKSLRRDPRIAVCVLDEGAPYGYVTVEGTATIESDDIVPGHIAINKAMRGLAEFTPPEGFVERLRKEGRVIIRVTARRVSGVTNRG